MNPPVTKEDDAQWLYWKQCLFGFVKDVMGDPTVKAFAYDPGKLAVEAFKFALDNWQATATAIKIAGQARAGYKPRYYEYPCIPAVRSFYKAVLNAYVMSLQQGDKLPAIKLNSSAALLDATDPFNGHPGDDATLEEMVELKQWPFKEAWKPQPYSEAAK